MLGSENKRQERLMRRLESPQPVKPRLVGETRQRRHFVQIMNQQARIELHRNFLGLNQRQTRSPMKPQRNVLIARLGDGGRLLRLRKRNAIRMSKFTQNRRRSNPAL